MPKIFDISKDAILNYMVQGLTYQEIAEKEGCSMWTVMERARSYGLRSNARKLQQLKNNVAKNPEVKERISKTVSERWQQGRYADRINGMLGAYGFGLNKDIHYREKVIFYSPDGKLRCARCGKLIEQGKIDIHHVDEDRKNNSLSNLEPLCNVCHRVYHLKKFKQPFVTITSTFRFDSAHFIPEHDKKCKFLHGHSYKLEVSVRRRIDPKTGMVIDFGKLKEIVNRQIVEVLDHGYINNFIEFPSSENIIVWIWQQLSMEVKGLFKLRLYETENNFSELTSKDVKEFVTNEEIETEWLDDKKLLHDLITKKECMDNLERKI